jgi:hypothetical protein
LGAIFPSANVGGSCTAYIVTAHSALLASIFLGEELGPVGRIGCALCLLGSLIIVLHAPPDKEIQTVDEILHFALQPGAPFSSLVASEVRLTQVQQKGSCSTASQHLCSRSS